MIEGFVLCTDRCGSKTSTRYTKRVTNFTVKHESRSHLLGANRFAYPESHIEVDNRLA
ncbi:hypothetical protein [Cypionkella sp. TWP1-2-1b2]|uniref:hypothetical protein n=1 Tax=Cypionkella sp. TWP1-2-1b2 TaxID=2804675 RepID=UPI003CF7E891